MKFSRISLGSTARNERRNNFCKRKYCSVDQLDTKALVSWYQTRMSYGAYKLMFCFEYSGLLNGLIILTYF